VRRQLANCLLEVKMGPESRVVQLRDPIRDPALLLNLEVDKQTREFELSDPPPQQKLQLRVTQLQNFAKQAKLCGQTDTATFTKPAVIEFEQLRGAEIEVRLFRNSTTGKLEVRSEPVFRERGEREFELTRKRLDALERSVQATLGKLQAESSSLQSGVASLRRNLQTLNANPPSNFYEAKKRTEQVREINASIAKSLGRIDDLQRQMPRLQARLAAVPQVREFIDSLHERAAIHFVVAAPCGNHQLILIDAQQPPSHVHGAQ
jgi:prefoldin subunit 5